MKNEYLISNEEQLNFFNNKSFEGEGIVKNIVHVPDKNKQILIVSRKSEDENSAKMLSKIHSEILNSHDLILLTNESSLYFLNKLFPHVIELELKLRKLLRLVSSLNDEHDIEKMKVNTSNLEAITLNKLFEYLFSDVKFNTIANELSKSNQEVKMYNVSKKRYIEILEKIEENTPWNQLLGNQVPTLVTKYVQIYEARNDIAHAHHIDVQKFTEHSKLFKKVIEELDVTIEAYQSKQQVNDLDYNSILDRTLNSYFEFSKNPEIGAITQGLIALSAALDNYSNNRTIVNNEVLVDFGRKVNSLLEPLQDFNQKAEVATAPFREALYELGKSLNKLDIENKDLTINMKNQINNNDFE